MPTARGTDREVGVDARSSSPARKSATRRLGLSHSTVKHHLANARSKVGAETTAQLVWILAPRLPDPLLPRKEPAFRQAVGVRIRGREPAVY